MDLDDLENADARSVGNSSSKSGGNFRDDLDSDEDDDGDGSIARLFSIEGLKRKRSDGESQLEAAKNDQAESVSQGPHVNCWICCRYSTNEAVYMTRYQLRDECHSASTYLKH